MKALLFVLLLGFPIVPNAIELEKDGEMTCDLAAGVCAVKIEVMREMIHARRERACWNRS